MKYGYVRVSARDQNIDRQIFALNQEGVKRQHIFIDKTSGKNFERSAYKKMIKTLKTGDELVVKSIDRFGRNYDEIIQQWHYLVKEKEIDIIILDFPLLNTHSLVDDITGQFLSDLCLKILSYVAQMEREHIKQRQQEGIVEAKKKGVRFGRPRKQKTKHFRGIYEQYQNKEISVKEGAKRLGVSTPTLYKWILEEKKKRTPRI